MHFQKHNHVARERIDSKISGPVFFSFPLDLSLQSYALCFTHFKLLHSKPMEPCEQTIPITP